MGAKRALFAPGGAQKCFSGAKWAVFAPEISETIQKGSEAVREGKQIFRGKIA
jgi:hypothetical protein